MVMVMVELMVMIMVMHVGMHVCIHLRHLHVMRRIIGTCTSERPGHMTIVAGHLFLYCEGLLQWLLVSHINVQLFLSVSAICTSICTEGQSCAPGNKCDCLTSGSGVCTAGRNVNL